MDSDEEGAREPMNATLIKALMALVPVSIVLIWSAAKFLRRRTIGSGLQVIGSAGLVIVVITHICESLHLFPWFGWGDEHSIGHYLNLSSAVLGITFLPVGYLLHRRERESSVER